jgi:hypothetical protein
MGLDTSHDCWHGAYSAFTRWRNKLAEVAGYQVADVRYDSGHFPTVLIDWGHIAAENPGYLAGDWEKAPTDPLIVLIAHSDCDGHIHPEHAAPLADRLEGLLPLLPDGEGGGHIGDWRAKTQAFIDGLRRAAAANEPVVFQ